MFALKFFNLCQSLARDLIWLGCTHSDQNTGTGPNTSKSSFCCFFRNEETSGNCRFDFAGNGAE